jgi:DNA (cytosine-5)-methyltransferase 1
MAGKRKGTDDERYLWGEMLRAIQEIKPKFVIAENVFGITNIDGGLVFEQVCLDLEAEGYEVQPFIIPACAKNAPHRRDRVWFIAYTNGTREEYNGRTDITKEAEVRRDEERNVFGELCGDGNASDTNCFRYRGGNIKSRTNKLQEWEMDKNQQQHRDRIWVKVKRCSGDVTNTKNIGQKYALENRELERGRFRFGNQSHTWDSFPLESPICGGDDGIPTKLDGITFSKWRAESIKGYGNAIVPQVAFELFKIIKEFNLEFKK